MKKTISIMSMLVILMAFVNVYSQKAGKGTYESREMKLDGAPTDNTTIIAGYHYLRIEVPRWFINNQSNFLSDKIISGTVEIKIGEENYNAVLGTFPLSGNNRVSPVFNRALIDNRVYNGGDLTIRVFIKGIKRDTAMGGLLKKLSDTAINVAVGQVGTMTGLGAVPALNDAGKTLTDGVKESLNQGESPYGIFEENGGLETTFRKTKVSTFGGETFWLAYRGNSLTGKQVKVIPDGQGSYDVEVDSQKLRQGAWVLFRISRESVYGNYRPWRAKAEQAQDDLERLIQNWKVGAKTLANVKEELTATLKGDLIADRILALRNVIDSDSVLSSTEQGFEKGKLMTLLEIAQSSTAKVDGYNDYFAEVAKLQASLLAGTVPSSNIAKTVFTQEFKSIAANANDTLDREYFEKLTSGKDISSIFAYSDEAKTSDVSLMAVEAQNSDKSKSLLKTYLENNANTVKSAVALTEAELWKRLSEIEQEKAKKRGQK